MNARSRAWLQAAWIFTFVTNTALEADAATPDNAPPHSAPAALAGGARLPDDALTTSCTASSLRRGNLSLAEAVDVALCNNPRIKAAWSEIKGQEAALGEATSTSLPVISAAISAASDRTTYPGHPGAGSKVNGLAPTLGITWRLFDFGEREANRHAAQAMLNAAIFNEEATVQKTMASVISAYFDAQSQYGNWQTRQQNEELARQTLEAAQRRQQHGAGAQSDTLQALTALSKAELERGRAYGAYQKALALLVYALGVAPGADITVREDASDATEATRRELREWLSVASKHPAVAAAQAGVEAAREKVRALRSQDLPTLDFAGNIYQNGRPNQGLPSITTRETIASVTLTIPLFDGFAHAYRMRGAQAQIDEKQAELEDTEHQVMLDVIKVHADATAALDNLAASQTLLNSASAALDSVRRRFDKGAADIVDILSAQTALADARQERIRCQAEWRSARLSLLAAAGVLGRNARFP